MRYFLTLAFILVLFFTLSCRRTNSEIVTVALSESFTGFDTLTTEKSDAAAERVRNLMFNGLVRKNSSFDYEGELASEIATSEDGKAITFLLRENIRFHNGKPFTSADVKYTFDELFRTKGYKSFAFFESVGKDKAPTPHIISIETPDARTVVFNLEKAALKNQLLSNLVAIPIVADGSSSQLRTQPVGTGPFKFVSFDQSQNTVDLESFADYWDGAPKVAKLRVKTVTDASALQAELQSGGVDIAPVPSNLPPDSIRQLGTLPNLTVEQFDGSNIQYIGLNTTSPPLDNTKIRQAIGYGIDREKIIKELLSGQAKIAYSILPEGSWAYTSGTQYNYDPDRARQLLKEAGYKNQPITFKFSSGNAAYSSYAQAIQNMLVEVGLNIQIETLDPNTIRENLAKGQFQLNTGAWIGGNQDPLFLKDLFTTGKIPGEGVSCCNRSRYSNPEVDRLLNDAINEIDRARAKDLYSQAWTVISGDLPLMPLWYPANMSIANKRITNIKINPSGDWSFLKDITVTN
ncbi:MAG TPA: ABC transporter substrate-binding protein [Pyrinomonadaceae bacterium]|nr:ABC transporter substrate-binding protein [Pyrinomonadaceae bacterium]